MIVGNPPLRLSGARLQPRTRKPDRLSICTRAHIVIAVWVPDLRAAPQAHRLSGKTERQATKKSRNAFRMTRGAKPVHNPKTFLNRHCEPHSCEARQSRPQLSTSTSDPFCGTGLPRGVYAPRNDAKGKAAHKKKPPHVCDDLRTLSFA